jgi:Rieske Fe-S protein
VVASIAACAGCGSHQGSPTGPPTTRLIDAGPAPLYAADGVYDHFRHQGFFLVTESGSTVALSSDCTHRDCPLRALPDRTFSCKCHGSRFGSKGNVLHGPATRSLPQFPAAVNDHQHLIVQVTRVEFDEG